MARDKLKKALRGLTRHKDPGEDITEQVFKLIRSSGAAAKHRNLVLVCTIYLENGLRIALKKHLPQIDDAGEARIFEDEAAPLRDFAARIRMARGLGIINAEIESDLNLIRQIRNSFAHSIEPVTLSTNAISEAFQTLNMLRSESYKNLSSPPFGKTSAFGLAVVLIYWRLWDHIPHWGRILSADETRQMVAKALADGLRSKDDEPAP